MNEPRYFISEDGEWGDATKPVGDGGYEAADECEVALHLRDLTTEVAQLKEALDDFGCHQSPCPLAHWSAGEPRDDGYYTKWAGKWYRDGEWPACTCGLDEARGPKPADGDSK